MENMKQNKIPVFNSIPIIFTKDEGFIDRIEGQLPLKEGAIVILPEDAVLVYYPIWKLVPKGCEAK